MSITKQLVYIGDFLTEAQKLKLTYGHTELYSTRNVDLDRYLHGDSNRHNNHLYKGGYGRPDGYEVIVLYGSTGIGKSTVALNLIADPIVKGKKVGLLVLEDDMADVSVRLSYVLSDSEYKAMNEAKNVRCLPKDALVRSWTLPDLLEYIEKWFEDGIELILLDHLQFAFEGAESIKGENEYTAQRVFMQKLNQLVKKHKRTVILISHINKNSTAKGMDRIQGSGAIAQAATKSIEVYRDDDMDCLVVHMRKSRFTRTPGHGWSIKLRDMRLENAN